VAKFAVIGLGNFGFNVARTLHENGDEVIGIDRNKDRAQRTQNHASQCIIADATDKSVLETAGLIDMDGVVVSLGENLSASILVTLFLKELGVENIIAKITSEDHGRALEKVGAKTLVFPERDTAMRLANSLSSPNIMDYFPLSPEYSITEVVPPESFIGKTLGELETLGKHNLNVIAIRELKPEKTIINPTVRYRVREGDILIVLGRREDIDKLS
jgi:trk system potassium uptake protein TrkA